MSHYYGTGPAFDTTAAARSLAAAPSTYGTNLPLAFRLGLIMPDASLFDELHLFRTGGNPTLLLVDVCSRSGSVTPVTSSRANPTAPPSTRTTRELLGTIQSAFGLSITAMAAALRVERPTIYAWLKETSTPTPGNAARLETIAQLADHWLRAADGRQYVNTRAEVLQGKSLNDLLRDEHLRTFVIEQALTRAARTMEAEPSASRPTVRELARQRGIRPSASDDLDILTGRRLGPEE